jgi:hypothetical protein
MESFAEDLGWEGIARRLGRLELVRAIVLKATPILCHTPQSRFGPLCSGRCKGDDSRELHGDSPTSSQTSLSANALENNDSTALSLRCGDGVFRRIAYCHGCVGGAQHRLWTYTTICRRTAGVDTYASFRKRCGQDSGNCAEERRFFIQQVFRGRDMAEIRKVFCDGRRQRSLPAHKHNVTRTDRNDLHKTKKGEQGRRRGAQFISTVQYAVGVLVLFWQRNATVLVVTQCEIKIL